MPLNRLNPPELEPLLVEELELELLLEEELELLLEEELELLVEELEVELLLDELELDEPPEGFCSSSMELLLLPQPAMINKAVKMIASVTLLNQACFFIDYLLWFSVQASESRLIPLMVILKRRCTRAF